MVQLIDELITNLIILLLFPIFLSVYGLWAHADSMDKMWGCIDSILKIQNMRKYLSWKLHLKDWKLYYIQRLDDNIFLTTSDILFEWKDCLIQTVLRYGSFVALLLLGQRVSSPFIVCP